MRETVALTYAQACRMGAPRAMALCLNFGGALDFIVGRWNAAEASLREAVKLYRGIGAASGEALSLQRLGVLFTARGSLEEALGLMEEGIVAAERATLRSHCLTRLHASVARNRLAASDLEGAQRSIAEGEDTARRHGNCVTCGALLLPEAVRVALAHGRIAEADARARSLEETASRAQSRAWTAMARHARGRVLAAQGERGAALAALAQARAAYLAIEARYDAARCQRAEAELAGDAGLEAEAARTFAELGAAGLES